MTPVTVAVRALAALIIIWFVLVVITLTLTALDHWLDRRLAERRATARARDRYRAARTRERLAGPADRRQAEIEYLNDMWRVS